MENHLTEPITDLCARVEDALKGLPGPEPTSLEELFATDSLWKLEVLWTCSQVIEYFRSIKLLIDKGMNRPAAALSRSVHECNIQFDYLVDNEDQLRDWVEWQLTRDYHQLHDALHYDDGISTGAVRSPREDMTSIEILLGKVPEKQSPPWKSPGEMLKHRRGTLEQGEHQWYYRLLIRDPSQYVHISRSDVPSATLITWLTATSVLGTFIGAMRLCEAKQIIDAPAGEIAALCNRALSDMAENLATQLHAERA